MPFANAMLPGTTTFKHPVMSVCGRLGLQRGISGQATTTSGGVAKESPPSSPPPLSVLSNVSLLRSLLITTITSKPYLLRPSLSFLSWLCSTPRRTFWNPDRNPILRSVLKNTFYKQFCGGETAVEVRETLRQMKAMGFRGTILTYAKETVFDQETNQSHGQGVGVEKGDPETCKSIAAWREGTLETIDCLGDGDQLALKLTGAGPLVTDAFASGSLPPKKMMEALNEVCATARAKNVRILVDAESQQYQAGIFATGMELAQTYNRDGYALLYNTYQAYLKSTPDTLARHLALAREGGFTLGLKLVRGAYMASDKRSLIHDTKRDTDDAYNAIAQGALKLEIGDVGRPGGAPFPSVDLFLASHNKESLLAAHAIHQERVAQGLPTVRLGFAQLHGMSDELSFDLVRRASRESSGHCAPCVYKCSTWGTLGECLAYLMRRAAENRDSVSRTVDEHRALKNEFKRRLGFSSN